MPLPPVCKVSGSKVSSSDGSGGAGERDLDLVVMIDLGVTLADRER